MDTVRWNDRQREVLETNGKNMLISAAAGSGKTAVLVEKIRRLMIDEGTDVSDFLIVTFTRAAASEMKEKIIKSINKAAQADPEKAGFLRKQLEGIGKAQISTYDSFAKDIVAKYFYEIGIDPGLRIADEQEVKILKSEAADEMMEQLYEEADPDVMRFMDAYQSAKGDRNMKEAIWDLYDRLRKMPEGIGWLEQAIEKDPEEYRQAVMEEAVRGVKKALAYYERVCDIFRDRGYTKMLEKAEEDASYIRALISSERDSLAMGIAGFKPVRMVYGKDKESAEDDGTKALVDDLRKSAKKDLDQLNGMLQDLDARIEDVKRTLPYQRTLLEILKKYEEIFTSMKQGRGVMDFDDTNHYALKILENDDVAAEYRDRFKYIFIDEYQDSNYMQEALIARVKRENNVFMVGDIKQSIYGFRHAEPDIFKQRGIEYSDEANKDSVKIDLNSNYRSKGEIIRSVNDVFSSLMDGYDDDAALVKGDPYDGELKYPTELHIIDMTGDEDQEGSEKKGSADPDKTEVEAALVAKIVEDSIGLPVYDSVAGAERPLEKRDIVILLRAAKGKAEKYYEALLDRGIEAYIEDDLGYYETVEVRTVIDMLKVIDNRYRDIPLLSVLKSGLREFSNDELAEIRLSSPEGMFSEAFFGYPDSDDAKSEELKEKIAAFASDLDRWADLAAYTPVSEFIWRLMDESGYYVYAGSLPAGAQRMANLGSLVEKASAFEDRSDGTLREFVVYVDRIDQEKLNAGQKSLTNEKDDIVRIMTVHKSKGLEFPMVIAAGLGSKISTGQSGNKPVIGMLHKDIGFALPLRDREKMYSKGTIVMDLIKSRQEADELEEEERILYVACTRAKDRLVLTGCVKDWEAEEAKLASGMTMRRTFLQMILSSESGGEIRKIIHKADDIDPLSTARPARGEREKMIEELFGGEGAGDEAVREEIERRLSYVYPYADSLEKKSKYSVSELNRERSAALKADEGPLTAYDESDAYDLGYKPVARTLRVPSFAEEGSEKEGGLSGAQYGTVMHSVMEHVDFAAAVKAEGNGRIDLIKEKIEWMAEKGLLLPEEAAAADPKKIAGFFSTDIGRRAGAAAGAGKLSKEKHFTIKHTLEGQDPGSAGEDVLVQGIIDCFFEETFPDGESGIVLVDYKTNAKTEGIEELYAEQIALYKEAIEKATGKKVRESYLYLFKSGQAVSMM